MRSPVDAAPLLLIPMLARHRLEASIPLPDPASTRDLNREREHGSQRQCEHQCRENDEPGREPESVQLAHDGIPDVLVRTSLAYGWLYGKAYATPAKDGIMVFLLPGATELTLNAS